MPGVARPGEEVPVSVALLDANGNSGVAFEGEIALATSSREALELPLRVRIAPADGGVLRVLGKAHAPGLAWVEALPKAQDTGFERVRLGLKGKSLAAMELHDQLGGRTLLRFSELKANAPVAPQSFVFTPPAGADVIEDAPRK